MTESPRHIIIVCSRLDTPGGIERAIVNTANLFVTNNLRVTLLVCDVTAECFYPLHPDVKIVQHPLNFGIGAQGNFLFRAYRYFSDAATFKKVIRSLEPGIVIATEYPFLVMLDRHRSFIPERIAWEHHHRFELTKNKRWDRLSVKAYQRAAAIVCLNPDEQQLYSGLNPASIVIPNFIEAIPNRPSPPKEQIVTIARLTDVKGIHELMETAALILQQHPGWQWILVGDGELKSFVKKFIDDHQLAGRFVHREPVSHDLHTLYAESSLYVMTSKFECFPMVLLEAQRSGLPCVAFDCETGPRHIIIDKVTGILVKTRSVSMLADAISKLIETPTLRDSMSKDSVKEIERFSPDRVLALWNALFNSL